MLQVTQARANRLSDTIAPFQALDGGWWNRTEPPRTKMLGVAVGTTRPLPAGCTAAFGHVFLPKNC